MCISYFFDISLPTFTLKEPLFIIDTAVPFLSELAGHVGATFEYTVIVSPPAFAAEP